MKFLSLFAAVAALSLSGVTAQDEDPGEITSQTALVPPPLPPSTGYGDPHFKTFTGVKFDYHGECDMVLLNNPSFANGLGMRLHIRTTRVKYWSYIEQIALQIGDDVLEFNNDVDNFLINGAKVGEPVKGVKTRFGLEEFWLRRDPKALSLRLDNKLKAKIDFIQHKKTHFPAVSVSAGSNQTIFEGSLGMLGQWGTGKMIGRDGVTEFDDAEQFALEWQVRSDEPMLFSQARFPQHPQKCTPPKAMPLMNRLGSSHMQKEAEKACRGWKEDKEQCIFDVIATRNIGVAGDDAPSADEEEEWSLHGSVV
jgi:hypothetical protein